MQKFTPIFSLGGVTEYMHLEGEIVPDEWVVSTWTKNGVVERSARPVVRWEEVGIVTEIPGRVTYPQEEKERSLLRAARRAKTMCRRTIITEGFNEVLTLTYRANQEDRALCKVHFKEWCRRMKKALGSFRFCAAFERQERGAMHVHVATHKLPQHADYKGVKIKAWEVGTRIWRDIVGVNNGLCFVGAKKRFGGDTRRRNLSLAKMASYVSKYIMKDFADAPENSNRYSRSQGLEVGAVTKEYFKCSFLDLIIHAYDHGPAIEVLALRIGKFGDTLWFCSEASPEPPC